VEKKKDNEEDSKNAITINEGERYEEHIKHFISITSLRCKTNTLYPSQVSDVKNTFYPSQVF